jgi:hypothetical protein
MKKDTKSLVLGFDVKVENACVAKPTSIETWSENDFKNVVPEDPFHYHSDALVGLSLIHLNQHLKNPFQNPKMNFSFCHDAWLSFEPHHELFQRSQPRIKALRTQLKESTKSVIASFERSFTEILDFSLTEKGIDLVSLTDLCDALEHLEEKLERPLIYNFQLECTREISEKLHYLHSMLFNLRALIALDYNAYIQDPTHEALKVDSITDYLSKAEYVANDALLYWQFKKMREQMPKNVAEHMLNTFKNFSHNGYCLIENLPKSFVQSMNLAELEETLYLAQMDWLLGTDAGLLFRIREELYALRDGYEKIFWPEADGKKNHNVSHLSVCCELTPQVVYPDAEAA